ncbi:MULTISPECIES: restriction endonuclease subunit S [Pseudomonadota]|uniref:restriction endonuclease subunit S n=1 Tax=Pseudomonadota TaxID=1224 RepID=UPI000C986491|nr:MULTISPECIES: restriction endonuclease subunit S [Pseudomonadota]MAT40230.1 restriction endonuclease [Ectothiorhodospiraceae bacterium]ELN9535833.1 restriction endonuclease subunit S [Pseudomonas aeruginosa]MBS9730655.1 restriction endonuclease subunit S [Pseudomonas aeruginosa]MBV6184548.1 restriction endonuclease subunit S [Pseudomonas aeruginosa]MCT5411571.1 restriction endonuclease subunit S [Pseudomonas aeruginosa]
MSENKKQQLVPRLRFPEFCDDQSWSFQSLGRLARRSTKKNTEGDITRVLTNSAEYGVIDQRDFFDKDIANQGNLEGYYIVEEGDYVYNPRISATAPVGPVSKNRIGLGVMSPLYTVFRFNNTQNDIYAHYFKSTHWHQYMRQASSTGARHDRMSITNDDFMGLPLPVSKPEEQQKIADCLSSLDDLIAAESQKLDTLKTHKKGLMQQLFPREGETVPRLRFPEFREAPAWGKEKLEKLITTVSPPSKLQSSNYGTQGKFPIIDQSQEFICGWTDDERAVITESLPLIIFGDHTCALKFVDKPFAQGADGIKILKVRPAISAEYLFHSLSHRPLAMEDYKRHFSMLKERAVVFPDIESGEQQKIADCLSSLDDLITAQTQKIDALKTHKKGLMQQLFPTLDEVDA